MACMWALLLEVPLVRRFLRVVAASATVVGLLLPSAGAVTALMVSYKGLPSGWWGMSTPCSPNATPSNYAGAHVSGPSAPPAQQGSLQVEQSAVTAKVLGIGFGATPPLSSLQAFGGSVYVPSTSADDAQMIIRATDGSTTDYALSQTVSAKDSWTPFDLTAGILSWRSSSYQTGAPIDSGTTTLSGFVSAHPGLALETLSFEPVDGCTSATFFLDNIHYTAGTTDATVDFEAPIADSLVNGMHPTSVLTGTPVTLSATLSSTTQVFATGQNVQLWARATGWSSYKLLRSLTTDPSTGSVSYTVASSSTASYQWRYPANGTNYAPVYAPVITIVAHQRVAITSRPTNVPYRGYATIKGRVKPNRSGIVVRLNRIVSGNKILVAVARTTDGYFTIKAPMTARGTYAYIVVAASYTGEATGQSSLFTIATR